MPLKVFYDGNCKVCDWEMEKYRREEAEGIEWIDISQPDFNSEDYGLKRSEVDFKLHAVKNQQVLLGVEAFSEIWRHLPRYHFFLRMAENPVTRPFIKMGYEIFIRIRPYLPKKQRK